MNKGAAKLKKHGNHGRHHRTTMVAGLQPQSSSRFQKKGLLLALAISGIFYGGSAAAQELTASSSSVAAGLVGGFNQAVAEARKMDFTNANYNFLSTLGNWSSIRPNYPDDPNQCSQATMKTGYFAGLFNRCAYYSRDYVHHAIGAYYLGMYEQNYQMAYNFVTQHHDDVISSTDIVTAPYWAIGLDGRKYEQRDESPAPFEIGENIANMYRLTGDARYLGSAFQNYISNINNNFSNTQNGKYISGNLNGDNVHDGFRIARRDRGEDGTYNEFPANSGVQFDIVIGGDMAASEIAYYRNVSNYPALKASTDSTDMAAKFNKLSSYFNSYWNNVNGTGHFAVARTRATTSSSSDFSNLTYFDQYAEEPNLFPLYKGIITDANALANQAVYVDSQAESLYQAKNAQDHVTNGLNSPGVESHTYLPTAFYNANKPDLAWKWLSRLAAWQVSGGNTTYPEVSFAMISDTITKVLGLDFNASTNNLVTLAENLPSAFKSGDYIKVSNIPIHTSNYTVHVGVKQALDAATGRPAITLDYAKDPYAQAGFGVHWLPRFKSNYGSHCNVFTTYANNVTQTNTYNLVWDGSNRTYTCNGDNGGIYLYANDPNYTVTSMTVTAIQ